MEGGFGWLVLLALLLWGGHAVYQGYRREMAPPLPMADNGQGLKVPVCAKCQAGLVTVTRSSNSLIVGVVALGVVVVGVLVLVLANWLAGLLVVLVGVLLMAAGKRRQTVLTCPACGRDARTLD